MMKASALQTVKKRPLEADPVWENVKLMQTVFHREKDAFVTDSVAGVVSDLVFVNFFNCFIDCKFNLMNYNQSQNKFLNKNIKKIGI